MLSLARPARAASSSQLPAPPQLLVHRAEPKSSSRPNASSQLDFRYSPLCKLNSQANSLVEPAHSHNWGPHEKRPALDGLQQRRWRRRRTSAQRPTNRVQNSQLGPHKALCAPPSVQRSGLLLLFVFIRSLAFRRSLSLDSSCSFAPSSRDLSPESCSLARQLLQYNLQPLEL